MMRQTSPFQCSKEHKLSNDPLLSEKQKTSMFGLSSPFLPQSTLDVGSCLIQQSLHPLNRLHHLLWSLHIYSSTEDTLCSTGRSIFSFLNALHVDVNESIFCDLLNMCV